ncbi:serine acetyltransferase [Pedobacter frigiditerrae]|uniref:serine O-acetyltransferase n=1 Tax=Pedobacter frigiditerrae TaxID=2530452 RepID=UPI00293091B9|nr:serine acetyltransferase [Pedobacter frigiditerrae]
MKGSKIDIEYLSSEELNTIGTNTKGRFFIKSFRKANAISKRSGLSKKIGNLYRAYYKIVFNYLLGIDIPDTTNIGFGFNVFHGQGLVISSDTIIGKNVTVRQNTTIGNSAPGSKSPRIGDNVNIGANVVIIGAITIGNNVVIAAGSVVIKDVPSNVMIAGNPAVVKKELTN